MDGRRTVRRKAPGNRTRPIDQPLRSRPLTCTGTLVDPSSSPQRVRSRFAEHRVHRLTRAVVASPAKGASTCRASRPLMRAQAGLEVPSDLQAMALDRASSRADDRCSPIFLSDLSRDRERPSLRKCNMARNGGASRSFGAVTMAAVAAVAAAAAMAAPAVGADDRSLNSRSEARAAKADAGPAQIVDAGWIDLGMGPKGTRVGPFRVRSPQPLALTFTDLACVGDRFQALDGHVVIGIGSPLVVAPSCGLQRQNWRAAFDRRFSTGLVLLQPGSHRLFFRTLSTFTGGFVAAFRVDICTVTKPTSGVLLGGSGRDVICGANHRDVLFGGGGRDLLLGGPGPDVLVAGGQEPAALAGGRGADSLIGGAGDNRLFGGDDPDVLRAGGGNDGVSGGGGADVLQGMAGRDALHGGPGRDALSGGPDRDICLAGPMGGLPGGCEVGHW